MNSESFQIPLIQASTPALNYRLHRHGRTILTDSLFEPSAAKTKTPWKSSPYFRCVLKAAIAHLLESLTFGERFPGTRHLGVVLLAPTVQFSPRYASPLADIATSPGMAHLSPT
ncbi:hypothetical protein SAMN05446635_7257 [Burkholderia sp. OK233]|nr:hypothetical protein SAMN05446635_7257 [Burkholderia sp. OK233]